VADAHHQLPVETNSVAEPLAPEPTAFAAPLAPELAAPSLVPGGVPPIRRTSAFSLSQMQTPELVSNAVLSASNALENPGENDGAFAPVVPAEVRSAKRDNPYHLGDLRRVWAEYVASLANQPAVQALLESMVVEVDPEHRVQLTVSNTIQEKYTAELRDSMLLFLREGLQNDSIDIVVDISREAAAKVVYTPDERFAYLAEKNPLLHDFRQAFQLDIE
jgi:DNA polymerase-3 subunit gamma/tau